MPNQAASLTALSERLGEGPIVLLVGQRYLESGDGFDPFTSALASHVRSSQTDYTALFDAASSDKHALQHWMAQLSEHIQPPPWLTSVLDAPWNAVYTSAIDSVLRTRLRNEWRDVQPVLNDSYRPANPRSPISLACSHLYGAVGEADERDACPTTRRGLLQRRAVATALLQRVIDDLTPLGSLLIVGYDPERDWLRGEDLAGMLGYLSPGQAHAFGSLEKLTGNADLNDLAESGILVAHETSLADVLGQSQLSSLGAASAFAQTPRSVYINNEPRTVPKGIWNAATRSAVPLALSDVSEPPALSDDARYDAFRHFLGSLGGVPNWEGLKRGFAFDRPFEAELKRAVVAALADRSLNDRPILLHGAAGTGKTTAIARIALEVAEEKKYPVLFVPNQSNTVAWEHIDQYLQWAEDNGASAALLVWDGMVGEPDQYFTLSQRLVARGRQVRVLGTAYQIENPPQDAILADSILSEAERAAISGWLSAMLPDGAQLLPSERGRNEPYWLALLYRALPPSRQSLRRSLLKDVERTEMRIRDLGVQVFSGAMTSLQAAMLEAGLVQEEELPSTAADTTSDPGTFERLSNFTMVPGRFGIHPPVDLVLRATGGVEGAVLRQALAASSVVVWYEDQIGNISLGPRNSVEAEIIVQSRLGTAASEIAVATELLSSIRDDSSHYGDGPEVRFATELVRAFGSGSREQHRFAVHWLELAEVLRHLRERRSVMAPRLMVQEANLRREWSRRVWAEDSERALEETRVAREVAESALELIPEDFRNARLRSMLLVEYASSAGGILTNATSPVSPNTENGRLFQETLDAIEDARLQDPGNYYPLDVLFWTTRNLLQNNLLQGAAATNALASIANALLTADPDAFPPGQQEQFRIREFELSRLLGNEELASAAWNALLEMGSGAGHYLEALRRAGVRPGIRVGDLTPGDAATGYSYLKEHWEEAHRDLRNLELALDLWWMSRSGQRLLEGERVAVAFSETDWDECLSLARQIEYGGKSQRPVAVKYVKGLAEFHLKRYRPAFDTFYDMEERSEEATGRKRLNWTYRASDPKGKPLIFTGTVKSIQSDGRRGRLFVPSIGRQLPFFPREFGWPALGPGDDIGEFNIAFNFRGAAVDSPRHVSVQSGRNAART